MLRRLTRSAIMLAVLVAAYNAYVLWAVPLMEPPLATRNMPRAGQPQFNEAIESATRYQLLLSNYFPKDHWSQKRPPKVIANSTEQFMLVFDEFKRREGREQKSDGSTTTRVDIERIAVMIFPTPPREGITPPRDAIIMEAPQGAYLEFDEFRPEVAKIGQILRGEFPGQIRIHSAMKEPGPEDDLLIEVSDLAMNTKLLYTSKPGSPVNFRMGSNVGAGTELEIRFLADDSAKTNASGLKIAGIDSVEIRRDVRLRVALDTSRLLPGAKIEPSSQGISVDAAGPAVQVTDATLVAAPEKPPVEVSCSGPFTFDCVRFVASLDHDVQLRQMKVDGPSDQLACSRLDIHFAPRASAAGDPSAANQPRNQQRDIGNLEPMAIVAEGHPAVINSPENRAQARGDRIQIGLKDSSVRISGGGDSMLEFGQNILQAPTIYYQHPSKDEQTAIGRFRANGPGSLRYVIDEHKPDQVLQAQWQTLVQLRRDKGQPLLILDEPAAGPPKKTGQAKLSFADTGSLAADQIFMYLRELEGGEEGIALNGGGVKKSKLRLAPDRLLAAGNVEIASPAFTGHTKAFSTNFKIQPEESSNSASKDDKTEKSKRGAGSIKYQFNADQMRLDVLMRGKSANPVTLACDGNIVLREVQLVPTHDQPLEIRGAQLLVEQLDTNAPHVTLTGAAPGQAPGTAPAMLSGRGVTMLVDKLEADGSNNRVWSNGPGKATMLVTRNITGQGQKPTAPFPVDLTWQNGFEFDGQTALFKQGIVVAGMESTLHCDQLAAKLASKVQIGQTMNDATMNPSEIECSGQVNIESITRDEKGVTSHSRMELARLAINQQTGAISGTGPGVIRTTQFGSGVAALAAPTGGAAITAAPKASAGSKLFFLRVDFHSGLDGNIYLRELTFHNRIRSVYGPVDSWQQELDLSQPESLPPDCLTLTCDDLRLNEDPLAARIVANANDGIKKPIGPVQLMATGNVSLAGQVPGQGDFNVQAAQASYDQYKDLFMLEGDMRTPAKLWRRNATGQVGAPTEARQIQYTRSTGEIKVKGIQYFEITPSDLENARRQKTPPK
jgi:hypothetical protein